ncbi:MAG: helix-turn-helix domain-containing protein [Thermoanaerobaculia bacterium]
MTETPETSNQAPATLGEELRRERELRGISLKEIADATKIGKRYLEAIEKSDFKTLPAPVFTRGFVREYARYLGLNSDELVARYSQIVSEAEALAESNEPTPFRPQQKPERPSREIPRPYAQVDRNWIWFAAILVVLVAVMWGVREYQYRQAPKNAVTPAVIETASPAPVATQPKSAAPPVAAATAPVTGGLVMELRVRRPSWIALEADGKTVIYEELPAGFRQTYNADEEFRFRTVGNAAGVEITLNGIHMPALGEEGEVIKDRAFDREFVQNLASSQRTR